MSVVVSPLVSSLHTGTIGASAGGETSGICHPWSTWDVMCEHEDSEAHAGGEFCCSSGVPLGDVEERMASPEKVA